MLKTYNDLPWPQNLWSTVFEEKVEVDRLPEDWVPALEHAFSALRTPKRRDILTRFFRDHMTLRELGDIYGTSAESVRQQAEKAIRMLRHPTIKIYLYLGMEGAESALSKDRHTPEVRRADEKNIDALGLSVRAWSCLRRAGIETVEQLIQNSEDELLAIRNMGTGTLKEIKKCLSARNLSLCGTERGG